MDDVVLLEEKTSDDEL